MASRAALAHVASEQRAQPYARLQVVALLVEVELVFAGGTAARVASDAVGRRHRLAEVLHGVAGGDDLETMLLCEVGVCGLELRVHGGRIDAPLLQALVVGRVRPGLLDHDLRLGRELADRGDEVVAEGVVGFRHPAEVARLLDGDYVPFVGGQHLGDIRFPVDDHFRDGRVTLLLHRGVRPVDSVGTERLVRLGGDHVVPVTLERTPADVERAEV